MTKEEFKRRWEKDENGDGITNDDCADCYEAWGLGSKPRCRPVRSVVEAVVRAAGCEAEPNPEPENCAAQKVGNAAALREALKTLLWWWNYARKGGCLNSFPKNKVDKVTARAEAALAAPPRNCDRFSTEADAQIAFLNEVWLISVTKETTLERDRFENWTDEMRSRYAKWLFDLAMQEGGEQ